MKIMKKVLSAALSLVLCGSLMAPAFAASFDDLYNAITDVYTEERTSPVGVNIGDDHYGYGDKVEGKYEIEAWDENDTRHVEVNANVEVEDTDQSTSIYVSGGKKVDLDLNDHTITGNGTDSVFHVAGGNVDDKDPTSTTNPGELTIHDGTVTNGGGTASQMDPEGGTDETITKQGGGIYAGKNATVTLDNTKVTGNTADQGGGIYLDVGAKAELQNDAEVSGNTGDDVYLAYGDTSVDPYVPSGKKDGASINTPDGGAWTDDSGNSYSGTVKSEEGSLSLRWTPDELEQPVNPSTPGEPEQPVNPATPDGNEPGGTVEVDDPDVPLAEGPVTCGEFIEKLWEHEGEPAPEEESREYAPAIAWAVSADIVSPETFDPEKALTVALAREFLTNFAAYADMAMPELTTLTGRDDDIVMDADGVLAEFFGE